MIDIAESRGLFGSVTSAKKSAANRQRRRDLGAISAAAHRSSNTSNQVKRHSVQVDRIAAPTQASLLRSVHGCWVPSAQELGVACPRHRSHLEESKVAEARRQDIRRWWREMARHIIRGVGILKLSRTILTKSDRCASREPLPININYIQFRECSCS